MDADFVGKAALRRIRDEGVSRKQVGLIVDGAPLHGPNTSFWPVTIDGRTIGKVTSAIFSPRLDQNIALAIVAVDLWDIGTRVEVATSGDPTKATVVELPFYDPKKSLATTNHP